MSISRTPEYEMMTEMIMSIMGVDRFAYIKPVPCGTEAAYAVFAADGTQLAVFDCPKEAFHSIRRHNLTPVQVH